jgi:hypothetical protein
VAVPDLHAVVVPVPPPEPDVLDPLVAVVEAAVVALVPAPAAAVVFDDDLLLLPQAAATIDSAAKSENPTPMRRLWRIDSSPGSVDRPRVKGVAGVGKKPLST